MKGVGVGQGREETAVHPGPSWEGPPQLRDEGPNDSRGQEERGVLSGVHDGLQVIDPTYQEKTCEGEEESEGQAAGGAEAPPSQASCRPGG